MKPQDILKKAPDLKEAVNALLLAKTYAIAERKRIDAMQRTILQNDVYTIRPEYRREGQDPRITDPKVSYLMDDEQFMKYHTLCQDQIVAMGYNVPKDHCPALIAERIQTEAEHLVIECAEPLTGLKVNQLLCNGMDNYHKYVDLCCKMIVSMPGYVAPQLTKA